MAEPNQPQPNTPPGLPQFNWQGANLPQTFKPDPQGHPFSFSSPNPVVQMLANYRPQSMTSVLPYIQQQFATTGQNLQPAINAINQSTGENVAGAQSDAMRRGLTGSDIEAAGMQGARQQGTAQIAQLTGQAGLQQAQTMAAQIMQAYGIDIQSNQQMLMAIAQALGQQMGNESSQFNFNDQLNNANAANKQAQQNALYNSAIQAGGQIIGGAVSPKPPVPPVK
jgi:hypothetical protein